MKSNKRIISSIVCIIIGIVLSVCSWVDLVDSYWTGMGTALLVIGILKIIRLVRYKKDESYREAVDTNNNDEKTDTFP